MNGNDFDLAVVGAGFGGSLLALIARRLGLQVLLIERGKHPRFAIGESTSPLANLVLEELCQEYNLPALAPLTTYGAWQKAYPELGCGLKRGFTFYHHRAGERFENRPDRSRELMVAASPSDRVADTHWLRADVDHFFVQQAAAGGVEYVDETTVRSIDVSGGNVCLDAETNGRNWQARASFLVDATGPRGILSRFLGLRDATWPFLNDTQALYSHFGQVSSFAGAGASHPSEPPPYPPEWAAVHHVFDGGWIWSLKFKNGITSAGVAARPWLAEELDLASGEAGWQRLLERFPSLDSFQEAAALRRFDYAPRLPHRSAQAADFPWALLPGAAAFVDPFLSSGIPLTLLGVQRLGVLLQGAMRNSGRGPSLDTDCLAAGLAEYQRVTLAEADAAALLISGCYAAFAHFELLTAYLMYYFAAVSYAEIERRLARWQGTGARNPSLYLRAEDHEFQDAIRESVAQLARWDRRTGPADAAMAPGAAEIARFRENVRQQIARINIAGLADPKKRNWYPLDLRDVVEGAACFGMTPEQMAAFTTTLPV